MHADMYYIGPLAFQHETLKAGNGPGEEARYRLQILYHKAALVCMHIKYLPVPAGVKENGSTNHTIDGLPDLFGYLHNLKTL